MVKSYAPHPKWEYDSFVAKMGQEGYFDSVPGCEVVVPPYASKELKRNRVLATTYPVIDRDTGESTWVTCMHPKTSSNTRLHELGHRKTMSPEAFVHMQSYGYRDFLRSELDAEDFARRQKGRRMPANELLRIGVGAIREFKASPSSIVTFLRDECHSRGIQYKEGLWRVLYWKLREVKSGTSIEEFEKGDECIL